MSQLGSIVDRFSIGIFDEQRGIVDIWATDQSGTLLETRFVARLDEKTTVKRAYDGWKSGLKTLIIDVQGEELREWIRYAREEMGIPVNEVLIHGRRINHLAYFSHGYLVIQSHEPLAQELFTILQRFAGVFNLTYTRFLDLKKAEAQAREAQISTALERIRNRTLLMRDSAELSEVAVTLFEEFKGMGLLEASDQTYFCTIDRQSKSAEVWITERSVYQASTCP